MLWLVWLRLNKTHFLDNFACGKRDDEASLHAESKFASWKEVWRPSFDAVQSRDPGPKSNEGFFH